MDKLIFLCVYITNVVLYAAVIPTEPLKKAPSSEVLEFMKKYGYLEPGGTDSDTLYSNVALEGAVKEVQRFGGIPQTGLIDNTTLQLMQSARCGVADIIKQRNRRYVLGPKFGWHKHKLTYFIANWSPKIGQIEMKTQLQKAFDAWAQYGRLSFKEVFDLDADIIIGFSRGPHGDGYPFDGPGLILAHAFFPGEMGAYAGDIHFDDDEEWKINPGEFDDGIDFLTVAVHELGHSLGLAHSAAPDSIMNPYYKKTSVITLGYDDILAMYELYIKTDTTVNIDPLSTTIGPLTSTHKITFEGDDESVEVHKGHDKMHRIPGSVPPLMPDTTPTADMTIPLDGCNGNFDVVAHLREEIFIFKDKWLWRLSEPGTILESYPVEIHRMFPKLPSTIKQIDAAYQRDTDSNIIFFTGDKYWVFDGYDFVENSPRPITDIGLPEYLSHVDGAMIWDKNKKTYFFSGDRYWRYSDSSRTMDPGYPQSIDVFRGVPHHLDSVFTWKDGITYFFKNKDYWAFNNTWKKTEDGYPQSSTRFLLNCPN